MNETQQNIGADPIESATREAEIAELAALGFRDLANKATTLRDELRRLGGPQEMVSRCDALMFKATVGENEAWAKVELNGGTRNG